MGGREEVVVTRLGSDMQSPRTRLNRFRFRPAQSPLRGKHVKPSSLKKKARYVWWGRGVWTGSGRTRFLNVLGRWHVVFYSDSELQHQRVVQNGVCVSQTVSDGDSVQTYKTYDNCSNCRTVCKQIKQKHIELNLIKLEFFWCSLKLMWLLSLTAAVSAICGSVICDLWICGLWSVVCGLSGLMCFMIGRLGAHVVMKCINTTFSIPIPIPTQKLQLCLGPDQMLQKIFNLSTYL